MVELEFIQQHKDKKLPEIALLLSKNPDLDKDFIINQINGLQKSKQKLPEFYNNNNIVYPATLSIEQCSSEQSAIYKSNLLKFKTTLDLTGGFGIDSYYFANKAETVTYLEPKKELFKIVSQNFKQLNANNIECINSDAETYLANCKQTFDLAYIDPSRRNETKKVFMLSDCVPNIVELQEDIFKVAPKILVKTSPILDLKQSIKELNTVREVWVISLNNDCKEVLYLLEDKTTSNPKINTVNIPLSRGARGVSNEQLFQFNFKTEESSKVDYSQPLAYLYEPNASILKAGAFKSICSNYGLKKIAPNTHLYTSERLVKGFPGRTFVIEQTIPYNPKTFKKLGIKQANVSCRNFKDSVEQVKKKLNLKDGGECFVFALTNKENKPLITISKKHSGEDLSI